MQKNDHKLWQFCPTTDCLEFWGHILYLRGFGPELRLGIEGHKPYFDTVIEKAEHFGEEWAK